MWPGVEPRIFLRVTAALWRPDVYTVTQKKIKASMLSYPKINIYLLVAIEIPNNYYQLKYDNYNFKRLYRCNGPTSQTMTKHVSSVTSDLILTYR